MIVIRSSVKNKPKPVKLTQYSFSRMVQLCQTSSLDLVKLKVFIARALGRDYSFTINIS